MSKKLLDFDKKRIEHWEEWSSNYRHSLSKSQLLAEKAYFFKGNLDDYLSCGFEMGLSIIIFNSPARTFEQLKQTIVDYWFWVLEDPDNRDQFEQFPDLNDRFNQILWALFLGRLDPDVATATFKWVYGETFEANRTLLLEKDGQSAEINLTIDPNEVAHVLRHNLVEYFWRQPTEYSSYTAYDLKDYFLSVYPLMDPACFSKDLTQSSFVASNGVEYKKSYISFNFWFLALKNGYLTTYEEDEDITELICTDQVGLSDFLKELEAVDMPEAYYELEAYVRTFPKGELIDFYELAESE